MLHLIIHIFTEPTTAYYLDLISEALLIALKIAGTSCKAKPGLLGCKLGGEYVFTVFPSNGIPDSVRKS